MWAFRRDADDEQGGPHRKPQREDRRATLHHDDQTGERHERSAEHRDGPDRHPPDLSGQLKASERDLGANEVADFADEAIHGAREIVLAGTAMRHGSTRH